jgi:hypothetical protein
LRLHINEDGTRTKSAEAVLAFHQKIILGESIVALYVGHARLKRSVQKLVTARLGKGSGCEKEKKAKKTKHASHKNLLN